MKYCEFLCANLVTTTQPYRICRDKSYLWWGLAVNQVFLSIYLVDVNNGRDMFSKILLQQQSRHPGTTTIYHTRNNNTIPLKLTARTEGVRIWMMHLMSGRAACIAECSMKPATSIPKLVVPCSTTEPCISIFTRLDAVISWYSIPNGFTRKCSWSWFNLACNRNRTHDQFHMLYVQT